MEPREFYLRGQLTACIRETEHSLAAQDRILRAQAFIRLARYRDALAVVTNVEGTTPEEKAQMAALESSCHSFQGSPAMARRVLLNIPRQMWSEETQFEIGYARMLLAWMEDAPDAMDLALREVEVNPESHIYGRWLYARSWVAALRGDFGKQLNLLEQAIEHIAETPAAYDVTLLASATRSLVHLLREISAPATFEFGVRMAESIPWTEDLEHERFLTFRGLAWAYALRGLHEKAFHYAYFARDIAPSVMWVTACYADQAYLARMAGENRSADALLRHAVACAQETDWTSPGEERVAILNLIELVADRDLAAANRLLNIYDGIPVTLAPRLALARDRRLHAMEEYARGNVLAASGDRAAAVGLLSGAYATFSSINYAWRAAAAALRLHAITDDNAWLARASEAVTDFSESSVARDIRRKAAGAEDPRFATLTPAQRRVFEMICEGLTDKQIAQNLQISPDTVKNHAARVRVAFGVHSRAALIAAIHRKAV